LANFKTFLRRFLALNPRFTLILFSSHISLQFIEFVGFIVFMGVIKLIEFFYSAA
jgi:hypothetical protein